MSVEHLDDLRAQAQYARERYQLYKAKAYGQRPTSPVRLRELERACEHRPKRVSAPLRPRNTGLAPQGSPRLVRADEGAAAAPQRGAG
jgi:hypothetical protein